jgi:site-specific recombinase XerC
LTPFFVAAYIEELQTRLSPPSVKQNLAAIRMLFDCLVTSQVVPLNPAASVRGPKYVVQRGKTPVLTPDQTRVLLDSIDISTVAGLRDRALVGVMVYSFARVSAVIGMNVDDYYADGKRWWIRLHEKGGKFHEVPAHHNADLYVDDLCANLCGHMIGHMIGPVRHGHKCHTCHSRGICRTRHRSSRWHLRAKSHQSASESDGR